MAAAHLGCIRRRLRREMRRALLTGPRWGEIYTLLSGTEPHKSSPRTPPGLQRQCPCATVPAGSWGCSSWMGCLGYLGSSWPSSVLAACGTWPVGDRGIPGFSRVPWGHQGTAVPARTAGPTLTQPGSVPVASNATGTAGLEVSGHVTHSSAVPHGLAVGVPCPTGEQPARLCACEPPEQCWGGLLGCVAPWPVPGAVGRAGGAWRGSWVLAVRAGQWGLVGIRGLHPPHRRGCFHRAAGWCWSRMGNPGPANYGLAGVSRARPHL